MVNRQKLVGQAFYSFLKGLPHSLNTTHNMGGILSQILSQSGGSSLSSNPSKPSLKGKLRNKAKC